jgi:hypothetical protein
VSDSPLDAHLRKRIDHLPRRVNDEFQNQGGMVNFVMVGSLKQVQEALSAADWHLADRDTTEAVTKAVLQTYQKKAYLTMPMRELYLFGPVQDYGYQQAEPYAVVASRHHFRIWKAPFQPLPPVLPSKDGTINPIQYRKSDDPVLMVEDFQRCERKIGSAAFLRGFRLLSIYATASGQKLWVITEANRALTTSLLPDERHPLRGGRMIRKLF